VKGKKPAYISGDILLTSRQELLRVSDTLETSSLIRVRFIDQSEDVFVEHERLERALNLGQEPAVLIQFLTALSVHERLNKLANI